MFMKILSNFFTHTVCVLFQVFFHSLVRLSTFNNRPIGLFLRGKAIFSLANSGKNAAPHWKVKRAKTEKKKPFAGIHG